MTPPIHAGPWKVFAIRDRNVIAGQQNFSSSESAALITVRVGGVARRPNRKNPQVVRGGTARQFGGDIPQRFDAGDVMVFELTSVSSDYSVSAGWAGDGFRVLTSRGTFRRGGCIEFAMTDPWAFVLVRRGAYRRRVFGVEYVVDADTGYVRRPGEERRVSFFTDALDELILEVEPDALDHLPALDASPGPFTVGPRCALAHRLLLHSLRSDDLDIELRVFGLIHECLAQPVRYRRSGGRDGTDSARRRLVGDCVELLHTSFSDRLGLVELARQVGASPFHLSRVFRETTGVTISQYRTRLRVHAVLDRLEAGDDDLAAVAADAGFADHSHMTRTVTGLVGASPSDLRAHLGAANPRGRSLATLAASRLEFDRGGWSSRPSRRGPGPVEREDASEVLLTKPVSP